MSYPHLTIDCHDHHGLVREIELPAVSRVQDGSRSRIEPPFDTSWTHEKQLAWHAAVVALDSDIQLRLWSEGRDRYGVAVGRSSTSPYDLDDMSTFLNGIGFGVRAARHNAEQDQIADRQLAPDVSRVRRALNWIVKSGGNQ